MTEEQLDATDAEIFEAEPVSEVEDAAESVAPQYDEVAPQYGVGPFSIREVALTGTWLIAFVVSFFSITPLQFNSVWTSGLTWILTIAVPSVAVFLIILRRLSPEGIRRVGSLGVDQFASVAFSVSAALWLTYLWETIAIVIDGGPWIRSWVMWVEFIAMLAGVVLTVGAGLIPVLRDDFHHRAEVVAHPLARPLRPISPRPHVEAPVVAAAAAATDEVGYDTQNPYVAADDYTSPTEAASAEAAPVSLDKQDEQFAADPAPARQQAFWVLVPQQRDVVDVSGAPMFRIGPTAWALAIEDRGSLLVIRDEDGREGLLHDLTGITRG